MGEQRTSRLERILQRVEEHVENWRKQDAALKAEADASRSQLWAEAAERGGRGGAAGRRGEGRGESARRQAAPLKAEAAASRSQLWAEAAERERLLAEAVGEEEAR